MVEMLEILELEETAAMVERDLVIQEPLELVEEVEEVETADRAMIQEELVE
jgi:hypothetical protein